MRLKWKFPSILLLCLTLVTAGCSGNSANHGNVEGDAADRPSTGNAAGQEPIEILFWHSMGGAVSDAMNTMIQAFNDSQDRITVTAEFQGGYADALTKLKSSMIGGSGPDIIQLYDAATVFMLDSGYALPMQPYLEQSGFDLGSLEPNVLNYYTVGGQLNAMPFNTSMPIFYYNADAFAEAGLDPSNPPETIEEIMAYAPKLTKKDSNGNIIRYGLTFPIQGWYFEQLISQQGLDYASNGNGREAKATRVAFEENGSALKVAQMWNELSQQDYYVNYGSKAVDSRNAFVSGQVAMTLDSTAALSGIIEGVGGKFEIGTGFFPKLDEADQGGTSIGGGALWLIDQQDDARAKAAWEFIQFMVSLEQQAYWHQHSGYFPVTPKAYELPEMQEHLKKFPQFRTAIDQLQQTSHDITGPLLSVMPEARPAIESELEIMLQGNQTPEEMVAKAAAKINEAIEQYNRSNP